MNIEGKITAVTDVTKVWKDDLLKATIVVEEDQWDYPKAVAVDLWWDKTEWVREYSVGDKVYVEFNCKVREYNDKWYNSISAWDIKKL